MIRSSSSFLTPKVQQYLNLSYTLRRAVTCQATRLGDHLYHQTSRLKSTTTAFMSQDLLAAFGEAPVQPSKSGPASNARNATSFSFFDDLSSSPANHATPSVAPKQPVPSRAEDPVFSTDFGDNDDDWGDFEGSTDAAAKPTAAKAAAPVPVATQFSRWLDEEDDGFKDYSQPTTKPSTGKWDFTKPDPPAAAKWDFTKPTSAPKAVARDPNVLFDAEDEPPPDEIYDDDDFGDFEGAEQTIKPVVRQSAVDDLLGGDFMSAPAPVSMSQRIAKAASVTKAPQPASNSLLDLEDLTLGDESKNAWKVEDQTPPVHGFGTLGALSKPKSPTKSSLSTNIPIAKPSIEKKPIKPSSSPKKRNVLRKAPPPQPVATEDTDEAWDDFEAWEHEPPAASSPPQTSQSTINIPQALTSSSAASSITSPPTNIPPPALVLSLFSSLLSSAETSFFKPLRSESPDVQQAIYAAPEAATYLKGLVALATVLGRIIAGRKHRWKRDTILAQSMRIGPSAAGGVSGLKLTSIDKAEVAKEDREVADALKVWQSIVGKLKSAIAEVKRVTSKDVGKLPELRETLPVKVAKEIEGGLKGNRPCALCGLKREERVLKVDFEVEDSFGEWWIDDPSMHRDCRNFWEQHRDALRSR